MQCTLLELHKKKMGVEKMKRLKRFGVQSVERGEVFIGHCECGAASHASKMRCGVFAREKLFKSIVRRFLYRAYLSACKAALTQPVRWLAVCGRGLDYIGRKSRSKSLERVTIRVCLKLLDIRQALLERIALIECRLVSLLEVETCLAVRKELLLEVKKFLLDAYHRGVRFDCVRHVYEAFDRVCDFLQRCQCDRHGGNYNIFRHDK